MASTTPQDTTTSAPALDEQVVAHVATNPGLERANVAKAIAAASGTTVGMAGAAITKAIKAERLRESDGKLWAVEPVAKMDPAPTSRGMSDEDIARVERELREADVTHEPAKPKPEAKPKTTRKRTTTAKPKTDKPKAERKPKPKAERKPRTREPLPPQQPLTERMEKAYGKVVAKHSDAIRKAATESSEALGEALWAAYKEGASTTALRTVLGGRSAHGVLKTWAPRHGKTYPIKGRRA